jgi:hypothetical protein
MRYRVSRAAPLAGRQQAPAPKALSEGARLVSVPSGCLSALLNASFLFLGLRGIEWANLGAEGARKLCIS